MIFPQSKIPPAMTLTQQMVYTGNAFRMFHEITVPAESEAYIGIQNGENSVHLFSRLVRSTLPDVRYEVRSGHVVSAGGEGAAVSTVFNMNGNSNVQSTNSVRIITAVDSLGDLKDIDIVGGALTVGNRPQSDTLKDPDDLKVLPPNVDFLLRFVNPNTDPADVLLYLKWFETAKAD